MKFADARKYKKEIKRLYKASFPGKERYPLALLYRKARGSGVRFLAVLDEDRFIGFVYVMEKPHFAYLYYIAVSPDERKKGYGSRMLRAIRRMYRGKTIAVSIESPDEKGIANRRERMWRLAFYERNGFRRLSVRTKEVGVVYELLGTGADVTKADYLSLMSEYLGAFSFRMVFSSAGKRSASASKR